MSLELTPREAEIYAEFTRLLPEHTSEAAAKESVAKRFGLSAHTVRKYVSAARRKGAEDVMPLEKRDTPFPANPVFPDKKQPKPVTFESVIEETERRQRYYRDTALSQEEADWYPQPEYQTIPIALTWLCDAHYGSIRVDYDLLKSHTSTILNTPNCYVAIGGDEIDNASAIKIPTEAHFQGVKPDHQARGWADLLARFDAKQKIAAMTWGNHTAWSDMAGIDVFSTFFGSTRCPFFIEKGGGVLHLHLGNQKYHISLRHTFWGNSRLNITNAPKRVMQFWKEGLDVSLLGHVHTAAGEDLTVSGKQRIAVVGGTYKVLDSWGSQWGGDAAPGGFTILFYPDTKRMQLCRYPEDAADIILGKIARLPKDSEPQVIDAAARFRAAPDESEVDEMEQSA